MARVSASLRKLISTGCRTSVCVESTIRYAMFRDYSCLLLADCTAEPIGEGLPRSDRDASLLVIGVLFGWVSESAALITALQGQLPPIPTWKHLARSERRPPHRPRPLPTLPRRRVSPAA
jgi:hypothetical protein